MIATGSETNKKNFSVIVLFSLSETERAMVNSHCQGNGKLIIDGFHSHCLRYLNPSEELISRL